MKSQATLAIALLAVAVVVPACLLAGEPLTLLPLGPKDLAAGELTPLPARDLPRESLSFSWPLPQEDPIVSHPAPYRDQSRSFTKVVSAAELRDGFRLDLSTPGAVVHVAPLARAGSLAGDTDSFASRITRGDLVVVTPSGAVVEGSTAFESADAADAPANHSLATHLGLSAFRVPAELGVGSFTFQAPRLEGGVDRYRVHVFEREAAVVLELAAGANAYLAGDTLEIEAAIASDRPVSLRSLTGVAVSPMGDRFPLEFVEGAEGRFSARLTLETDRSAEGLPWQIAARSEIVRDDVVVRRDAKTSVAVAVPTARLTGEVRTLSEPAEYAFGLEAASAGRYEIRGVLFGTSSDGRMFPLAAAHAARWVEAGRGELVLHFDDGLSSNALSGPYEIRDLRLIDQGQRGLLHHQAGAVQRD